MATPTPQQQMDYVMQSLRSFRIVDLKVVLRHCRLSLAGRKAVLMERVEKYAAVRSAALHAFPPSGRCFTSSSPPHRVFKISQTLFPKCTR